MRTHSRPARLKEEPLYDPEVPAPTPAERARTLVVQLRTGTLCTLGRDPEGHPYGSFVTFAFEEGDPVFLFSELAEHTRNLRRDPRASLLVAEDRTEDPLANGRVTLLGTCLPAKEASAREAFLAAHPNASYYADFKDFSFWRLSVDSIRYIGGYGRMAWIAGDDWSTAAPDPLAPFSSDIVAHMNSDHVEAMVACCRAFSRATEVTSATMTAIDRRGFELSALTGAGPRPIRIAFEEPVTTAAEARRALIALVDKARRRLAQGAT